ncbi:MAG: hypothetical protein HQL13_04265 [Candidatus Omnitrophica bacterium]|nr:hypothetical protein [Candidatus Omnitrophota bacterium]
MIFFVLDMMTPWQKLIVQFDLRNMDAKKFVGILKRRQNAYIQFLFIAVALIMAAGMIKGYYAQVQRFGISMSLGQEKLDMIKARNNVSVELKRMLELSPGYLNEFFLTKLIVDCAKLYHIHIPSLSPAQTRNMGLYDLLNVRFKATCGDFKDLLLFLRKIENAKMPVRVNFFSGEEVKGEGIVYTIEIGGVRIHS